MAERKYVQLHDWEAVAGMGWDAGERPGKVTDSLPLNGRGWAPQPPTTTVLPGLYGQPDRSGERRRKRRKDYGLAGGER